MDLRGVGNRLVLGAGLALVFFVGYLIPALGKDHQLASFALAVGAFLAAAASLSPRFAFYALLVSSMFSRYELPVGEVHLRADQLVLVPVVLGIALRSTMTTPAGVDQTKPGRRPLGAPSVVLAGLVLYVMLNALSSFLFSAQPTESFKIVIWLLLSLITAVAVYLVVGTDVGVREALLAVLGAGFVSAAVGILFFVYSWATGSTLSIQQDPYTGNFAATGTFFEANIFGSFQAFSATAGLVLLDARRLRGRALAWLSLGTGLSILALVLSYTRAAWLGFLVGVLVFFFFRVRAGRSLAPVIRILALALVAMLVLVPTGLLTSLAARFTSITDFGGGTIAYRLVRFKMALADWSSSPIFGLGTNSFGQRHLDPTQNYAPDYLANLFATTLYDVGAVGLSVFLVVFGTLIAALISVVAKGRWTWHGVHALALLCGMVALLISYQATNAFWFSYNWIIMAIAARLCRAWRLRGVLRGSRIVDFPPRGIIKGARTSGTQGR